MAHAFLIHGDADHVGVAVRDIQAGEHVEGVYQNSRKSIEVHALNDIPLGHKIALVDLNGDENVLKYNEVIGATTDKVQRGQHVHVHNIKTLRWG